MLNQKLLSNFAIANDAIAQNKFRSFLTALGIVFGVAAVIAMISIGNGAKANILKQLELIGTNNIIIQSIPPESKDAEENAEENSSNNASDRKAYSPGLNLLDVTAIRNVVPNIKHISVEVSKNTNILKGKNLTKAICKGVNNEFFKILNIELKSGHLFAPLQLNQGSNVCIVGSGIAKKLFLGKNPIGETIKCGNVVLTIIGVIKSKNLPSENFEKLNIESTSNQVFIPINTFFLRMEDRSYVSKEDIKRGNRTTKLKNYHQLDKIYVKVNDVKQIKSITTLINRILQRRHNERKDYTIEVPELLIKQQESTQETLNLVLSIIAGISLLVGGIGIMNIMLSSVLERTKEIGIRRSLGAQKKDVTQQFLIEAVLISLIGGIIGIGIGVAASYIIGRYANIDILLSPWSMVISFVISFLVGVIFGFVPAQRAAELDPIKAIRV